MENYLYAITVKPSIGKCYGELALDSLRGACAGTLGLLGTKNAISGDIRQDGEGMVGGMLKTLLRSLPFIASGSFAEDSLKLKLTCGSRTYDLYGKRKDGSAEILWMGRKPSEADNHAVSDFGGVRRGVSVNGGGKL